MDDPEVLRTYASIFEKPRRDYAGGELRPASPACLAAAKALKFLADVTANEPAIAQYYLGMR
jgi:hypothetical protein